MVLDLSHPLVFLSLKEIHNQGVSDWSCVFAVKRYTTMGWERFAVPRDQGYHVYTCTTSIIHRHLLPIELQSSRDGPVRFDVDCSCGSADAV